MNRETRIVLILIIAIMIILPSGVHAAKKKTIEGRMQGLNCVIHGHVCPVDGIDPHIVYEPDFVLHLVGTEHYLLLNVPHVVKVRYVGDKIRVTGDVNQKYRTMKVEKLEVKRSGKYEMVWSPRLQDQHWERWKKEFYEGSGEEH